MRGGWVWMEYVESCNYYLQTTHIYPHIILFSHISHIWLKNGNMTPSLSPEKSGPKINSV